MSPEDYVQRYEASFAHSGKVWSQNISEQRYQELKKIREVRFIELHKISCSIEGKISFEKIENP
jgi:hypothetical protein